MHHFVSTVSRVKMVPLQFIMVLSVVYNNILYVAKPPNANTGYITFKNDTANSTVWKKMEFDTLEDIQLLSTHLTGVTNLPDTLWFKIKFVYPKTSIETLWQKHVLSCTSDFNTEKVSTQGYCISSLILSVVNFLLCLLISIFLFVCCHTYNVLQ